MSTGHCYPYMATTSHFWEKNRELLEMNSFFPSYTYLGSWQTTTFREKILETLGDALTDI